jgi:hypothetical protein
LLLTGVKLRIEHSQLHGNNDQSLHVEVGIDKSAYLVIQAKVSVDVILEFLQFNWLGEVSNSSLRVNDTDHEYDLIRINGTRHNGGEGFRVESI